MSFYFVYCTYCTVLYCTYCTVLYLWMYLLYVLYAVLNCSYCTLHTVCQNTCYCSAMSTVGALAHICKVLLYSNVMYCSAMSEWRHAVQRSINSYTLRYCMHVWMRACMYYTLLYCTVLYNMSVRYASMFYFYHICATWTLKERAAWLRIAKPHESFSKQLRSTTLVSVHPILCNKWL